MKSEGSQVGMKGLRINIPSHLVIDFETEIPWEVIVLHIVGGGLGEPQEDVHLVHHHPVRLHLAPVVHCDRLLGAEVEREALRLLLC